ncbi:hypothetical protein H0E87_007021 [Populus deltoides]|uniref:HhH-GPD domain-containing protein n=1 Tax=Populus deltoides TaxID=3696 RepID=A0A8T2Z9I2_POPDE|nr:hypothetical protein H0E87_007021 [Populus deltoides]
MPQTLPVEKPVCSPGEPVQRQSGKEGNDETEIKNRSQNGKAASKETKRTTPRGKNKIVKDMVLRRRKRGSFGKIYSRPRSKDQMDSVDWEAVRQAETSEIASIIEARGQQTIIAGRIKGFLNRVVEMHKSIELEWLRYAPPDDVKDYLLEFTGLGLKSVECVRLLSLQHVAFPVDINVAWIVFRLGWAPLKPLPGSLQFHLIEEFPILDNIQKYLWPRLCVLDHRTLYELHYQMITFGKPSGTSSSFGNNCVVTNPMPDTFLDGIRTTESGPNDEEIPTIKLNLEEFNPNGQRLHSPYSSYTSQALVSVGTTPLPAPKMKSVISWRTEHQVYELPDNHELLVWLDKREKDDSVPFLLSVWQAGETPNSSQPPVKLCNSQGSQLCDQRTCFACEGSPKRLTKRFHCALSRMEKNGRKGGGAETDDAKAITLMPAL